jgi:hypothetical protein
MLDSMNLVMQIFSGLITFHNNLIRPLPDNRPIITPLAATETDHSFAHYEIQTPATCILNNDDCRLPTLLLTNSKKKLPED